MLYTRFGDPRLRNAHFRTDLRPVDESCDCHTCGHYTRACLYHLNKCGEILGARLDTLHNLRYYQRLMAGLRAAIEQGRLVDWVAELAVDRARGDRPL